MPPSGPKPIVQSPHTSPRYALVLGAGGARAAYQVGVLKAISEACPDFRPTIFSGVSAGSINSTFLAQGGPLSHSVDELYDLWKSLQYEDVFKTNFKSLFGITYDILNDLLLSKVTKKLRFKSVLNATPLIGTLREKLPFKKVQLAVLEGRIDGVAVTATNHLDGKTNVFFHSHHKVELWDREYRRTVPTVIRPRHIMASCSIPIIFEPVRFAHGLFGDGSLSVRYPFSPAIHLGATHVLAIGIQGPPVLQTHIGKNRRADLGLVVGSVLDSMFQDNFRSDYLNILRINELGKHNPDVHRVIPHLIRPSIDPGTLARDYLTNLPFHFRQLIKTFGDAPEESSNLLSYLMFSSDFIEALLELGKQDARASMDEIKLWMSPQQSFVEEG